MRLINFFTRKCFFFMQMNRILSVLLLYVHTRYNLFAHSSCKSVFILIFINPQYTVLHILSHCTFFSFYFINCSYFHLYSHLYLYIFSCVMFHCFIFIFFCTVHWADPFWLTFHYWLYPVWLCMWRIIKNLEPWALQGLTPTSCRHRSTKGYLLCVMRVQRTSVARVAAQQAGYFENTVAVEKLQSHGLRFFGLLL